MPFTLFCHLNSPDDAAAFFRGRNAIMKGNTDEWSATFVFPGKFLQKKKTITFKYSRQWCSQPNWSEQIMGMLNYIGSFQMADDIRARVVGLIREFKFAIGILNEPEISKNDDPRFDVMHSFATFMQGCFFTPGALLDASFRAFATVDGTAMPGAQIPETAELETSAKAVHVDTKMPPPTAERVAQRMYVLLALAARGLLDMNLQQGNTPAYCLDKLHEWFEALNISKELEPQESKILYTAERKLSRQNCINSVWSLEAIAVLAWALELTPLPPYDQLVETDKLLKQLSFPDVQESRQKISTASLRPASALARFHEHIFAYDWRMVDYRVNMTVVDFANIQIGSKPFDLSWAKLINGDLALQGKRIDRADSMLVRTMGSLSMERHKASNWLHGYAVRYADISHDT